jgi:hypothetical protein
MTFTLKNQSCGRILRGVQGIFVVYRNVGREKGQEIPLLDKFFSL